MYKAAKTAGAACSDRLMADLIAFLILPAEFGFMLRIDSTTTIHGGGGEAAGGVVGAVPEGCGCSPPCPVVAGGGSSWAVGTCTEEDTKSNRTVGVRNSRQFRFETNVLTYADTRPR